MIDFTKPLRTKGGQPVELISTTGRDVYPVIGYVGASKFPCCWNTLGQIGSTHPEFQLENVPPKPVEALRWLLWRQYPDGSVTLEVLKYDPRVVLHHNHNYNGGMIVEGKQPNDTIVKVQKVTYKEDM